MSTEQITKNYNIKGKSCTIPLFLSDYDDVSKKALTEDIQRREFFKYLPTLLSLNGEINNASQLWEEWSKSGASTDDLLNSVPSSSDILFSFFYKEDPRLKKPRVEKVSQLSPKEKFLLAKSISREACRTVAAYMDINENELRRINNRSFEEDPSFAFIEFLSNDARLMKDLRDALVESKMSDFLKPEHGF